MTKLVYKQIQQLNYKKETACSLKLHAVSFYNSAADFACISEFYIFAQTLKSKRRDACTL